MVEENGGDAVRGPATREAVLPRLRDRAMEPGGSTDSAPSNSVQRGTRGENPRGGLREGFRPLESPD